MRFSDSTADSTPSDNFSACNSCFLPSSLSPLFIALIAESRCIITWSAEDDDDSAATVVADVLASFDCVVAFERTIFDIVIKAVMAPVIKIVDGIFVLLVFIFWKSIYNINYNGLQPHY